MKVSDYIVSFLIAKMVRHVFGYPGGMVTHLMDSLSKAKEDISAHVTYHEQGAALAACGYAQASLNIGAAYATSGPGATNLITGICNAYFDSIPVLFLTGQVNTYESKGDLPVRQKGFQEMDIVSMVSGVTKYSAAVTRAEDIRYHMEKAFYLATTGRPGPVLLDIPMDIQRADIFPEMLPRYSTQPKGSFPVCNLVCARIYDALKRAKRPCVMVGSGVQSCGMQQELRQWIDRIGVPVVSSMPAIDLLPGCQYFFGFIGAYGHRYANSILAKSDLIISLGSRMDLRQIGANPDFFATGAQLIRVDIDAGELSVQIKKTQQCSAADLRDLLPLLNNTAAGDTADCGNWPDVCREIKYLLEDLDSTPANILVARISDLIDADALITTDVGQNQVWVAQSFISKGQRILFSGGHGAMGYSLPAAIGAHYATGKKVISFQGDGGIQMNIQELQFVAREKLPIKIVLLNNRSLGMIRHFQEMYFESDFTQTTHGGGYSAPDFRRIAGAYGLDYGKASTVGEIDRFKELLHTQSPAFLEIALEENTYVYPKLAVNKPIQDQEPALDKDLYQYICGL